MIENVAIIEKLILQALRTNSREKQSFRKKRNPAFLLFSCPRKVSLVRVVLIKLPRRRIRIRKNREAAKSRRNAAVDRNVNSRKVRFNVDSSDTAGETAGSAFCEPSVSSRRRLSAGPSRMSSGK